MAIQLEIPYVSQLGPDAQAYHNDCGPACGVMLLKAFTNHDLTVDQFYTETGHTTDVYTSYGEIRAVLYRYDLATEMNWGLDEDRLEAILTEERPIIALIKYQVLAVEMDTNSNFQGQHFVVIVGVDDQHVILHDPLWPDQEGKNWPVPLEIMDRAWGQAQPHHTGLATIQSLSDERVRDDSQDWVRVGGYGLNVRSEPRVAAGNIVGFVHSGKERIVLERRQVGADEWGRIGPELWIALKYDGEVLAIDL